MNEPLTSPTETTSERHLVTDPTPFPAAALEPAPPPPEGPIATAPSQRAVTPTLEQTAYLLQQLLEATPHHRLAQGKANRRIPLSIRKKLGLSAESANQIRAALAQHGYIQVSQDGPNLTYELTDAGRERLQQIEPYPPPPPPLPPVEGRLVRAQKAYLLLQLFKADDYTLARGKANVSLGPRDLQLTVRQANFLRHELAREGLVTVVEDGQEERYTLTARGLELLATLEQFEDSTLQLTGKQLNALLALARGELTGGAVATDTADPIEVGHAVQL